LRRYILLALFILSEAEASSEHAPHDPPHQWMHTLSQPKVVLVMSFFGDFASAALKALYH